MKKSLVGEPGSPNSRNEAARYNYALNQGARNAYKTDNVAVTTVQFGEAWGSREYKVSVKSKNFPTGNLAKLDFIDEIFTKVHEAQLAHKGTGAQSGVFQYTNQLKRNNVNDGNANKGATPRTFYIVFNQNPEEKIDTTKPHYVINVKSLAEMQNQTTAQPVAAPIVSVPAAATAPAEKVEEKVEEKETSTGSNEASSEKSEEGKASELESPKEEPKQENVEPPKDSTVPPAANPSETKEVANPVVEEKKPAEEKPVEEKKEEPVPASAPATASVVPSSAAPALTTEKEVSKVSSPTTVTDSSATSSKEELKKELPKPNIVPEEAKKSSPVEEKKVKVEEPKKVEAPTTTASNNASNADKTTDEGAKKVEAPKTAEVKKEVPKKAAPSPRKKPTEKKQAGFVSRIFSGFGSVVGFLWRYTGGALFRFVRSFF